MAAGLAARPAAAAARLQGGDAALEGDAPAAAEAAGPDRVRAPAGRRAPALPPPRRQPAARGGRLRAGAAAPAAGDAAGQPHGGRVPVQLPARRGRGCAAALPAQAQHPPALRAQRGGAAGAGAVQAAEPAAALRVPQRAAGEPRGAGPRDAAPAPGGATAQPAGRLHRRHHPEPAGRGEVCAAAVAGAVAGAGGGGAGPAALADLLAAAARPRSPCGAPGAAHPPAAGRRGGRRASPRPGGSVMPGAGTRSSPGPWGASGIRDRGLMGTIPMESALRRGVGDWRFEAPVAPPAPMEWWPFPLCSLGDIPGISGISWRRSSSGWPLWGDLGRSKPRAFGTGVCCDPSLASPPCPLKCLCVDAEASSGIWGWGERPGLLCGAEGAELGVGEGNPGVGMP